MAWYKQPIQPMDPVIKDPSASLPETSIRYLKDTFDGSGQDSNTLAPAQDQSQWQQLTNIMPITQGGLLRRWGYQKVGSIVDPSGSSYTRLYSYQNNNNLTRKIIMSTPTGVVYCQEPNSNQVLGFLTVYTPLTQSAPRMVQSRNIGYFYNGGQADLRKWNGGLPGSATTWGIAPASAVTLSTSAGPFFGSSESVSGSGTTWTNPANILVQDANPAITLITSSTSSLSQVFNILGFNGGGGFGIPGGATITGIQVSVFGSRAAGGLGQTPVLNASLLKNNIPYGQTRSVPFTSTLLANNTPISTSSDLFGGFWTAADINNPNFGVQFWVSVGSPTPQGVEFFIDALEVAVYFTATTSALSVAVGGAGNVNLTVGRIYYCVYHNSSTGHYSDLNQPSTSSGPCTNSVINLSNIPVSSDLQVDSKVILATADGGDPSILYFVTSLPNANTTYIDNTPETTLLLNQQYLFTDPFGNEFGVTFNDPPPNGSLCIKHKGRLWMAQQQNLFFSKAEGDLTLPNGFVAGKYEESWPPQNYFDISAGAETISGLFSDGNVIYIGTQNHIRRIFGDAPTNFQQPEICHQDVGVLVHETWQNVYLEGTPTGFMWVTPDLKVMGSDGNTYLDVGHPIQDVLNSINPTAATNSHAMFVQQGPFDLYILAIPTGSSTHCDTHCIFNMRSHQWSVWKPFDPSDAMLFNVNAAGIPQWLFTSYIQSQAITALLQYTPLVTEDRVDPGFAGFNFTSTALTSWLHLGSPSSRKVLDDIEIVGDPNMIVSIDGASTQADFSTPNQVVLNAPLVLGPFKTYKVFLAGKPSLYKYYQLEFESTTNTDQQLLNSYSLRATPWNTL